ncbi:SDR family oxidoreductase [Candidatus Berkiella aquae]|uniref:3-oxoacyl-[acyl-carrier-protein] reductase FabG n=1 Tax=Candidatus Berkiella aquae TaxID=295108 RepID=A0A0Q9YP19_9GAMM|nr:SDR family oxidoreductase [Candidatus Berkiella aquae]MCS5712076.1 SDR family oxidoreductase [Candidatus Berkiella aquae]
MDLGLKNKTVLITGSTKGIGLATARLFLKEGAKVTINGRSQQSLDSALKPLQTEFNKDNVQGIVADVATEAGILKVIKALPQVEILINNAGIFKPEEFPTISRASWLQFFETNVLSGAQLTQHYLPLMIKKNWGRIIFISSESAISIPVEMVHYGMTKTAQLAISRGAAELCRGTNVTVNSVLPGPTLSDGVEIFIKELGVSEETMFKEARPNSIAQRFAQPEEVANLIVYVASERAAMTNGSALRVDGGTAKVVF